MKNVVGGVAGLLHMALGKFTPKQYLARVAQLKCHTLDCSTWLQEHNYHVPLFTTQNPHERGKIVWAVASREDGESDDR